MTLVEFWWVGSGCNHVAFKDNRDDVFRLRSAFRILSNNASRQDAINGKYSANDHLLASIRIVLFPRVVTRAKVVASIPSEVKMGADLAL